MIDRTDISRLIHPKPYLLISFSDDIIKAFALIGHSFGLKRQQSISESSLKDVKKFLLEKIKNGTEVEKEITILLCEELMTLNIEEKLGIAKVPKIKKESVINPSCYYYNDGFCKLTKIYNTDCKCSARNGDYIGI
jgi:hypothetical protein